MYCTKCGHKSEIEEKFCSVCGSPTQLRVEENNNVVSTNLPKKTTRNWLLWWDISDELLKKQVEQYHTLSIFNSARGQSALLLLFSAIVTLILILISSDIIAGSSYIDVVVILILALFVYNGQKWALIFSMILWTIEKGYLLVSGNGVSQILWWLIYMNVFWLAYKVELARNK